MNTDAAALIDRFFAAHVETDESRRRELLDGAVTDDAAFHGLQIELIGKEAIAAGFRGPARLVRTGPVAVRGAWLTFPWEYRTPTGEVARTDDGSPYGGVAFAQTGPGGLLRLVVPFLGQADDPPGADDDV